MTNSEAGIAAIVITIKNAPKNVYTAVTHTEDRKSANFLCNTEYLGL